MTIDDAEWARLLVSQEHVVSRGQALACGWTRGAIAHRLRRGYWQTLVPGVLLTVSGTPTARQRLRGALVHAGPLSALAATTACRWHGLTCGADDGLVHVAVPARVRVASNGFVRVHPTVRPWWSYELDGLPVVPVARAVIDAALGMTSVQDVRALCADAVQRRRTSPEQLTAELAGAQSAGSAVVRRVLAEVSAGARSAPEAALLQSLRRLRGIPPYALNVDVHAADGRWLARPDVVFFDCRVIVEVDGWRWHRDPERQRADVRRHTRLEAEGWTVLRYAAAAVLASPDEVAREIAAVVRARAAA
jgi:hypothetical protein